MFTSCETQLAPNGLPQSKQVILSLVAGAQIGSVVIPNIICLETCHYSLTVEICKSVHLN